VSPIAISKGGQFSDRYFQSTMLLTFHEQGDHGPGIAIECNTLLEVYRVIRDMFPETSMQCEAYFEIVDTRVSRGTYWWCPATIDVILGCNTMEVVRNRSTGHVRWCRKDMALRF